jgi:broad specificity phosphatase PhoE
MELIFVRHARPVTEINTDRIADPGLSELGAWQVDQLTAWLAHEEFDAVVTSPKARATQTVRPTADAKGLSIEVLRDLDEIDRGSFVYHPTELLVTEVGDYWEQIAAQNWAGIGWDSPDDFHQRCADAFEALVADPPGERVLVGCHGGTIGAIVAHVLAMPARKDFGLEYASITRVEINGDQRRLRALNETGHFDAVRSGRIGAMRTGDSSGLR